MGKIEAHSGQGQQKCLFGQEGVGGCVPMCPSEAGEKVAAGSQCPLRYTVFALRNKATVEGLGESDVISDTGLLVSLSVSKQPAIMPGQSYGLEDGSSSYKDFSESRNNRFSTPEQAAKNRIQHPSNVLHFFNAPLEVTEENFFEVSAGVLHHNHLSRPFVLVFQQVSIKLLFCHALGCILGTQGPGQTG